MGNNNFEKFEQSKKFIRFPGLFKLDSEKNLVFLQYNLTDEILSKFTNDEITDQDDYETYFIQENISEDDSKIRLVKFGPIWSENFINDAILEQLCECGYSVYSCDFELLTSEEQKSVIETFGITELNTIVIFKGLTEVARFDSSAKFSEIHEYLKSLRKSS